MQRSQALFTLHTNPVLDQHASAAIRTLIDATVADEGTLGFSAAMTDAQLRAFAETLQRRMDQGSTHMLLGTCAATDAAAFLVVLTQNTMPNCQHIAELSKGVVHPEFRGRGAVKVALREMVKKARSIGVEKFVLDVREGTRAHDLWKALGFTSFGVLEDYARVGGKTYRGQYMEQTVASLAGRIGL